VIDALRLQRGLGKFATVASRDVPAKKGDAASAAFVLIFRIRESTMNNSISKQAALAAGLFGLVLLAASPAQAQRKSAQDQRKLIKVFVNKSRCFTLVDRGAGMNAAMGERALASSGELRGRSNIGKGQIKAADYVLVPDLISQNSDAGGNALGGLLGGLVGGNAGAIIGGLNFKKKTADVVLTVTDVRSSEQVAMAEGNAKKTDIGWGAGGGLFGGSGLGAAGVSGYANTELGQVITLAYLQAYTDLIAQLGGLPANASAANATQAVTVAKASRLLANSKGTGKAVRTLDPGMMLYPTGNKDGMMWEVEDELGNKGWVNSTMIELSR
jgi:curli biogenesis system outer membrane secretion channel CsgG